MMQMELYLAIYIADACKLGCENVCERTINDVYTGVKLRGQHSVRNIPTSKC